MADRALGILRPVNLYGYIRANHKKKNLAVLMFASKEARGANWRVAHGSEL